ncbi:hypothetical protein [uncultured Hymenobacter sp.]|uniref:hypothetical protein n=1 Tax=uncultured Hymenobacter sp. TaxID=170016 RepID=UPI0035CAF924
MMLRHSQYVGLLRLLATRHKKIQHTDAAPRFVRLVVSQDPQMRVVDMHELVTKIIGRGIKPGLGQQVLVAESCVTDYLDNTGDNRQRLRHAAFLVLVQVKLNDHDAIEVALDETEQTAEEIMGGLEHQLSGQVKVRVLPASLRSEAIGPLGDGTWYGTRLDFDFTTPASAALAYNPNAFN